MQQDHKRQIEEIIDGMKCPKDFKGYRSGLENLCRARDLGIESFLECLEDNTGDCRFSLLLEHSHLCKCPLRVYIAKELKK